MLLRRLSSGRRVLQRLFIVGQALMPSRQMENGDGRRVKSPFIVGVSGGTASGKSTVCRQIRQRLSDEDRRQVVVVSQDSFYRDLTADEARDAANGKFDFDHPDAFDQQMLLRVLQDLKSGKTVSVPSYDYIKNCRLPDSPIQVGPADVILVEGILIFYDATIRDLFNMKLFVDADSDSRLARRLARDISQRGRTLEQVLDQYERFVKPAFEEFCLPTKKYADVIIPRGAENDVAIELIVQHVQEILRSPRASPAPRAAVAEPVDAAPLARRGVHRPH